MWLRWVVSNLLRQVSEDHVRQAVDKAKQVVEPAVRRQLDPDGKRKSGENDESAADKDNTAKDNTAKDNTAKDNTAKDNTGGAGEAAPCELVVAFAVSVESGGLVDRMTDVVTTKCASFVERVGQLGEQRVAVCETGVGNSAAALAIKDMIALYQPRWVVSAGFAGALLPSLRRGHIVMPNELVDDQGGSLTVGFEIDESQVATNPALHVGRLLTVDHVVRDRQEKEQLAEEHGAIACDMETMAIAKICQQHQVRFLSVRVISDLLDDKLPVEVESMLGQQTIAGKLGAATGALWRRPGSVKDMWQLRETAIRAADRLAAFVEGVLPQL